MSFLIEDILNLKDKTYKTYKKEDEPNILENNKKITYSQNNTSILENSLRNHFYYHSFLSQNDYVNSLSSPVFKHYTDYRNSELKFANTEKYYNRYNYYSPYASICLNNQMINKSRKGGQIRFTINQTEELEKHFNSHKYLSPEDRKQLAALLCLSDRQVKTWFQNRRAKWRKCNNITEDIKKDDYPLNINNNNIKNDYLFLRG